MNETKIAVIACPVCGSSCSHILFSLGGPTRKVIACNNIKCQYMVGSDVAHNTLCADIEKGRRYDELEEKAKTFVRRTGKAEHHLDTAVRLLGECMGIFGLPENEAAKIIDRTDDFLDLPVIKAILKAQGEK